MKKYCLELNSNIHVLNPKVIGNKAYNLARFMGTARVPNGFIVTTAVYDSLRKVLSDNGIFEYAKLYVNGKLSEDAYLNKISECFKDIRLEPQIQNEIINQAKTIGGHLVVRSSAVQEDSLNESFAGIFDSFLDVKPSDVGVAIINVYKSLFSPRAIKYITEKGLDIEKMEMACIVQEFISNAKYGVGFFFEKGGNKYYVIEAVTNDPSGITAGSKKHDTYVVDIKSNKILKYTANSLKSVLFDFEIEEITTLMKNIGNEIFPLDIEWAYSQKGLFLLQARPLTTTIPIGYGNQLFSGLPASSGICSGEAVIYNPEKPNNLTKGKDKILVVRDLPIENSQIIKDFGGVIVELAGVTSHIAILAREYKIPCVVGLDKATEMIKPLEHIKLDGNSGTVISLDRKGLIITNKVEAEYPKPDKLFTFRMNSEVFVIEKDANAIILHYNPLVHEEIKDVVKGIYQKFKVPVLSGSSDVWGRYWILLEVSECDKKIENYIYKGIKAVKAFDIDEIDSMINKLLKLASIYYTKSELMYIDYKKNKNGSIQSIIKALYYSYYAYSYWSITSNVMLRDSVENALLEELDEEKKSKLREYVDKINLDEHHPLHKIGDNIVHLIDDIYFMMKVNKVNMPESFYKLKNLVSDCWHLRSHRAKETGETKRKERIV